jgi:hypothetical protein
VTASAGTKGDTDKANVLSEAQSMVVRDYLVNNFQVDDQRIKTMGLGKVEDSSEAGKVEIILYPASSNTPAPSSAPGPSSAPAHAGKSPAKR